MGKSEGKGGQGIKNFDRQRNVRSRSLRDIQLNTASGTREPTKTRHSNRPRKQFQDVLTEHFTCPVGECEAHSLEKHGMRTHIKFKHKLDPYKFFPLAFHKRSKPPERNGKTQVAQDMKNSDDENVSITNGATTAASRAAGTAEEPYGRTLKEPSVPGKPCRHLRSTFKENSLKLQPSSGAGKLAPTAPRTNLRNRKQKIRIANGPAEVSVENQDSGKETGLPPSAATQKVPLNSVTGKAKASASTEQLNKPFKCVIPACAASFTLRYRLIEHVKKSHKKNPLRLGLYKHQSSRKVFCEAEGSFKCPVENCKAEKETKVNLSAHIRKTHKKNPKDFELVCTPWAEPEEIPKDGSFKCPIKGCLVEYPRRYLVNWHIRRDHNLDPKEFELVRTPWKRKPEASKPDTLVVGSYKCPIGNCQVEYAARLNMQNHIRRKHKMSAAGFHLVRTPWSTPAEDAKPYKCFIEGCSAGFATRRHVSGHVRGVHGIDPKSLGILSNGAKPFRCRVVDQCHAAFALKRSLYRHIVQRHKENPEKFSFWRKYNHKPNNFVHKGFRCVVDGCDARYSWKCGLDLHVRSVHLPKTDYRPLEDAFQLNSEEIVLAPNKPNRRRGKQKKEKVEIATMCSVCCALFFPDHEILISRSKLQQFTSALQPNEAEFKRKESVERLLALICPKCLLLTQVVINKKSMMDKAPEKVLKLEQEAERRMRQLQNKKKEYLCALEKLNEVVNGGDFTRLEAQLEDNPGEAETNKMVLVTLLREGIAAATAPHEVVTSAICDDKMVVEDTGKGNKEKDEDANAEKLKTPLNLINENLNTNITTCSDPTSEDFSKDDFGSNSTVGDNVKELGNRSKLIRGGKKRNMSSSGKKMQTRKGRSRRENENKCTNGVV